MAAVRHAQQQLLLASSEAATAPKFSETATAALTAATAAAAIGGASAGGPVVARTASVVGGGVGLEIEKGPSSAALKLEELKAELQAVTAAKKKVGQCWSNPRITHNTQSKRANDILTTY